MGVGHEELPQPSLEPGRVNVPVRSVVVVVVVSLTAANVVTMPSVTVRVRVDIVAGMRGPVHAPAPVLRLCGAVV